MARVKVPEPDTDIRGYPVTLPERGAGTGALKPKRRWSWVTIAVIFVLLNILAVEVNNLTTGNSSVTGKEPLIGNSVIFTLQGLGAGFNAATDIYNIHFQYGTSLCEPHYPGIVPPEPLIEGTVPEPLTAVGLTVGLAGLGRYLRRRK